MGWFSKSKQASAGVTGDLEGNYHQQQSLPVAIAVMEDGLPAATAPFATTSPTRALDQQKLGQQSPREQPRNKKQVVYLTRLPTMLNPCPYCNTTSGTRIRTAPDIITWMTVLVLLLVFWPLCWVPLVTDSTRRTDHYCLSCDNLVGSIGPYQDCCVKNRM